MKVVLISLARRGGMVHFLAELANALSPMCETCVVTSTGVNRSYFGRKIRQIPVDTGAGALQQLARSLNPIWWLHLYRTLAGLDADVIHVTGVHPWNPIVTAMGRMMRKPVVIYTVHDPDPHPGAPLAMRLADWLGARLADHVFVLSREGRRHLLARGFTKERVSVIVHPVYSLFRRWRPRSKRPRRLIVYLGRIERYKGVDVLLAAFQEARPSLSGWRLLIAGSGAMPEGNYDRRGVSVRNRFLSDRELARVAYDAEIIALPYTSASQSGIAAIALAVGRPVIATSTGGLGEMVLPGRTGLVVPPGNATAFAAALKKLAGDPSLRARMRRDIARACNEKWNPQRVAKAHVRAYRSVIRKLRP